jgi:hypothetical protein
MDLNTIDSEMIKIVRDGKKYKALPVGITEIVPGVLFIKKLNSLFENAVDITIFWEYIGSRRIPPGGIFRIQQEEI